MTNDLQSRLASSWHDLMQRCGLPEFEAARFFQWLLAAYQEPWRFYHNLRHIADMIELLSAHRQSTSECELLELAVWFHDAVYETRAKDNEERSANLAVESLRTLKLAPERIVRVAGLILMTREHRPPSTDGDAQLFLDSDLAILGSPPHKYKEYAAAIRQEYFWVPEPDYRAVRSDVLQRFLARPRIFSTESIFRLFEAPARRNLAEEIADLS